MLPALPADLGQEVIAKWETDIRLQICDGAVHKRELPPSGWKTFELDLEVKFSILQSVMIGNGIPESE